ncbi:MAG: winged helix DNA-binding domain-containing protein [Tannerellaceae bacterium]|nr:winged helix DNA-binding domain-containing protein [Tannerellaceae bacterium]
MNTSELLNIRLYNQLLAKHGMKEPVEVVSWMGAMQSQSLEPAKWAIGARLGNKTVKEVDEALNSGQIIRTHILRPTWHFVPAEDIHWMFDLSNPHLKPVYQSYVRMMQVDEKLIYAAIPVLEKILQGNRHLTKQEISDRLASQGKAFDIHVLNQVIHYAEREGLVVNGRLKGKQQTFALLEEFAPRKQTLSREEALERLARRYFTSHAPATIHDFAWWSGLSLTECKRALETIQSDWVCETVNGRVFWMRNDLRIPAGDSALLLPPFDEYVVSYKDRSEMIDDVHYGKVMTKNGLFSPTIVLNGRIVGSWKKTVLKGSPRIELSFFEETNRKTRQLFAPEIARLERFYQP